VESHRLPLEKVQQSNQVSIPIVDTENWGENRRLPLEKVQQSNRVSIPSVNTENWGEANMADASPRTDISTDADTDDKNQRVLFFLALYSCEMIVWSQFCETINLHRCHPVFNSFILFCFFNKYL
jgi:hypothetical protein